MDLFAELIPPEEQHPNFKAFCRRECEPDRKVLQSWAEGFVDRDGKFVKEFQTTFNSSFWEIYLHAAFKELGFAIDYSHPSPDFVLRTNSSEIVAEATTTSHPAGFRAEWERDNRESAPA